MLSFWVIVSIIAAIYLILQSPHLSNNGSLVHRNSTQNCSDEPHGSGRLLKYTFEIDYRTGYPDGVRNDWILTVNGKFPGLTIEAEVGDVLQIDVINKIKDGQNTSIHWHGIEQRGSPFQDGVAMVTQCPIRYDASQRYEFPLQQWGTFWYHGHVGSQYTEGLWGALIIRNKTSPYQTEHEILITLSDYYHTKAMDNEIWYFSKINVGGETPYPDAFLLNGKGRYPCDFAETRNATCYQELQYRDIFKVATGGRVRFRIINASSRTTFKFSIDKHILPVVEVDGVDVATPVEVDIIEIAPAQRYSFIISTNMTIDDYVIKAEAILYPPPAPSSKQAACPNCTIPEVTAILRYVQDKDQTGTILIPSYPETYNWTQILPPKPISQRAPRYLQESILLPFDRVPAPLHADEVIILNAKLDYNVQGRVGFTFNDTSFYFPKNEPLLHTILRGAQLPAVLPFITLHYNSVVKIIINNYHDPHPFHLHGHNFWIVAKFPMRRDENDEPLPYDKVLDEHNLNYTSCKRDTVLVPVDYVLIIVFIADNPGSWVFHCHIDWHNFGGMAFIFNEAPDVIQKNFVLQEEQKLLCQ